MSERSAEPLTVTVATAVSFPGAASAVAVVTALAVFVIAPTAVLVNTSVIVSVDPAFNAPIVQTTGPLPEHEVPPVELTDVNVPPRKVSVTVTAVVGDGPLLRTLIVNVAVWVLRIVVGAAVCVTTRSACGTATRSCSAFGLMLC